jgi:hypothetical protein
MPTLKAFIFAKNGGMEFGAAAKRLEVFIDGSIGQWKLYLNNSGGASTFLEPGQYLADFGVDQHTLIKGYVEDISPEVVNDKAVFEKFVTVEGKSIGRDLGRLFIKANFTSGEYNNVNYNLRLGVIFNVSLLAAGSQISHNKPDMWNNDEGPIIDNIEANDMYLIDLFSDAAQKAGYDFTVNWDDTHLYSWPLTHAPHTGVTLKSIENDDENNILLINPHEEIGSSIFNYIKVKTGSLNDQWTEETATYLSTNTSAVTLFNDYTVFSVGQASIRAHCQNAYWKFYTNTFGFGTNLESITVPSVCFNFPLFNVDKLDYSNIPSENCSVMVTHDSTTTDSPNNTGMFVITIIDNKGHKLYWFDDGFKKSEWNKKLNFVLGYNSTTPSAIAMGITKNSWQKLKNDSWSYTDFTWIITSIEIGFLNLSTQFATQITKDGYFSGNFWVDGLFIPSLGNIGGAFAIAQDTASINKYGKSMITVYRPELKSQLDLQKVADETLFVSKDPFEKLKLVCKFQPYLLYTGLLVDVIIPNMGIGSTVSPKVYRVLSIRHIAEPGVDLCRGCDVITELELILHEGGKNVSAGRLRQASSQQNAVNVSVQRRLETLEDTASNATTISSIGKGSGGEWDGGVIGNSLILQQKMPFLNEQNNDVYRWLMTSTAQLADHDALIRFNNIGEEGLAIPGLMQHLDLYSVFVSNGVDHNPGLMVGHHLLFRGDFMGRGVVKSLEGVLILHGGLIPSGVPGAGGKVCGWAPSQNPMIWLAEGAANSSAATLEIRTGGPMGWSWGHFEANNILSHGFVGTSNISTLSGSGNINLNNSLVPTGNETIDLGAPTMRYRACYVRYGNFGEVVAPVGVTTQAIYSPTNNQLLFYYDQATNKITLDANVKVTGTLDAPAANPFNQQLNTYNAVTFNDITNTGNNITSGDIICHGRLAATHIASDNHPNENIAIYDTMIPARVSNGNHYNPSLGTQANYWENTYANHVYGKDPQTFGCERGKSGQEWIQDIQDETTALDVLTHEVTKTLLHVEYSKTNEDEIICVCGKSVKHPCPEHVEAWNEKYCKSERKRADASSFLLIEHAADLGELRLALEQANERIAKLEKKLHEVKVA